MNFIFSLVIWTVITFAVIYLAQIVIGLAIWLVTYPFMWGYKKLKKEV